MRNTQILLILLVFLLTSCGTPVQTPSDPLASYEMDEYLKYLYTAESSKFDKVFSPEEYVEICSVISDMSAEPCYAISKHAIFIHQTIATYNTSEEKYLLIDENGNIITDYGNNAWVVDPPNNYIKFGTLTFVKTNGNPAKYNILDQFGQIKNTINFTDNLSPKYIKDLGNGYFLFATISNINRSSYDLFILHPTGECYEVNTPTGYWNADILVDSAGEETTYSLNAVIGTLNEGLFSVCYRRYMVDAEKTCAYYCDTNGNLVINLSSEEMDFTVTELCDFSDGKAAIKFIGADKRNYNAYINTSGELIGEPTPVT